MSRNNKLYIRLEQLEAELKQRLKHELTEMKETGNGWFLDNTDTLPYMSSWLFKKERYRYLMNSVVEIESLREKLKEPTDEGIAYLYRKYSLIQSDRNNEHRLGPKRLAEKFLADL